MAARGERSTQVATGFGSNRRVVFDVRDDQLFCMRTLNGPFSAVISGESLAWKWANLIFGTYLSIHIKRIHDKWSGRGPVSERRSLDTPIFWLYCSPPLAKNTWLHAQPATIPIHEGWHFLPSVSQHKKVYSIQIYFIIYFRISSSLSWI